MAVLSYRVGAGLLLAWTASSCVLQEGPDDPRASGPGFPHAVHVEQGFDCATCHEPAEGADLPSMPSVDACLLCHEEMDDDKPPERRASALFAGDAIRPGVLRLDPEVRFSHGAHAGYLDGDCSACHGGIESSARVLASDALAMDDCTACHDRSGVDPSCATCHTQIDRDRPPATHLRAWTELHGEASLARGPETANRCDLCHVESSCNQCHNETRPQSHTNFWRLRGHAVPASLSRSECAVCHRDDFCTRCHDSTRPLSHVGAFGSVLNQHCLGCHFPLRTEGCFVCHKATPSHQLAAPQPADHAPGANCRLCHGFSAPLPHVDDGSNCALCHQ